jgi:FkbM family methyltransferase
MIKIVSRLTKNKVLLGSTCEFELVRLDPRVETRAFLRHQGIFYLKPLSDWTADDVIYLFPEAPGEYILAVEWRSADGSRGWVEQPFEVVAGTRRVDNSPQKIRIDRKTRLWVPSKWEARRLSGYEKPAFKILSQIVQPGWVVYDVGANIGLYSIRFSRLVGKHGHVYCLEANPVCVYFLRANLELNGAINYDILPVALLDSRKLSNFTINYGHFGLGITRESSFYAWKVGHEIAVQSYSLDELAETYNLRNPDLIKIDIEGAEEFAVMGMEKIISHHRPIILLEVHGKSVAEKTFRRLDRAGYRYQDTSSRKEFHAVNDLLSWFPDALLQIICFPLMKKASSPQSFLRR